MSVKQDEQCEWCEKQEKLLIKWAEKRPDTVGCTITHAYSIETDDW